MNYNGRLNQLEKKINKSKGPVHKRISVSMLSNDEFERSYALYQARLKLGLVKLDDPKEIFAGADDIEDKYKDLSVKEAKAIYNTHC